MIIQLNLWYLIYFLLSWIIVGLTTIPLTILNVKTKLPKARIILSLKDMFSITIYGLIGFIMTIYELISNVIDRIFGQKIWVLTTKIGKPSFKYGKIERNISHLERYLQFHPKGIKRSRGKCIYENSFPKEHPNYFKLIYKRKRIRNP